MSPRPQLAASLPSCYNVRVLQSGIGLAYPTNHHASAADLKS